jgi:hypothetical protein
MVFNLNHGFLVWIIIAPKTTISNYFSKSGEKEKDTYFFYNAIVRERRGQGLKGRESKSSLG